MPELDAEGQAVPQGARSTGISSTFNEFNPSFKPDAKPEKKVKTKRRF